MKKVILFGEPMALLIADTAGDLKNVEHFTRSLSGAEVNVSIGLSRLGHKAEYLTRLGDDPFGHYIKESLEKNNIGTDLISFDEIYRTGIQLKNRVTDGSDPFAPYYRKGSAASHISPNEIEKIDFTDVDLVHVTGIPPALSETARAATFKLMEKAKENSIPITFDPNLRPALWEDKETMVKVINELATFADVILPGVEECETLVGTRDMDKISDFYKNIGVKTIIIKDGKNGAFVNDGDSSFRVDGFNVEKVVDTVGAGDGFAVGVISGILEGLSTADAVKRGNAIGAIQVMNVGDNEGLPMREELEKFIEG